MSEETKLSEAWTSWRGTFDFINRYAYASSFVKDKVVLDIACGPGWGANYLSRKGARKVVGGDISKVSIRYATARYCHRQNMLFLILDAQRLPFRSNTFDIVISLETIEHVPNPEVFLNECKRVLREGGLLICSTPLKPEGVKPEHAKWSVKEFRELIGKYFYEESLAGIYYPGEKATTGAKKQSPVKYNKFMGVLVAFLFGGRRLIRTEEIAFDLGRKVSKSYFPQPLLTNSSPCKMIMVAKKANLK
ncbi:class I SAM-dependent methyltransferase [Dehalococcoidia bacterium]|nr:class I SAM-dependent methyltransferase [Dehalococcoidia bacterium]